MKVSFSYFFSLNFQKKPGLSSYAKNPDDAANSLLSLLKDAETVIPSELRKLTPVKVGVMQIFFQLHILTLFQNHLVFV